MVVNVKSIQKGFLILTKRKRELALKRLFLTNGYARPTGQRGTSRGAQKGGFPKNLKLFAKHPLAKGG